MELPLILVLVCTTVVGKFTNTAVTNEEEITSNHAENYLGDKNSTNFTTVNYENSVYKQNNITSTDGIELEEKTSNHVDVNPLNSTSTYFSNDRGDMNANRSTGSTYLNDVNSTILLNTNVNASNDEKEIYQRGLPEEIEPSFGFDKYKKEGKVNVHSRDRATHLRRHLDTFDENKRDNEVQNREEVKLSGRHENLVDDRDDNDRRYFNDNDDQDEDYGDDYDFDEDVDMKDNEEFGIRDSLDDLIRKTVTGRDSILRRIFSRRRFFRRIIDK